MLYTLSCHGNKWSLPCYCTEGPRVFAEQEAARIRGQFSKGTDDPGGKHTLTLFIFSFSLSTPPRTCSFPPCLLQPLRTMWFPLWPLIFLLNHLCVRACLFVHVHPHIFLQKLNLAAEARVPKLTLAGTQQEWSEM